ncbi:nitrate- and nitrite sensing domain-containing protein [Actinomadura sp. 6N118]|uniref:sensor histidine kinase n=1 Tax=Actinomadura sp. 6N118 TaxID=3375151 RepID=UPI003789C396
MRFRNSRLRTKIAALLLSLAALWAFAAWVTLREGLGLLWASTLDEKVSRPTVSLVTALQKERRLSLIYLGNPGIAQREALNAQRMRTNAEVTKVRKSVSGGDVSLAGSDTLERRIREMLHELDALNPDRGAIDSRRTDRLRTAESYNGLVDAAFRVFGSTGAVLNDEEISKDSRTLTALIRAKEILSREDALLAGAIAAGRYDPGELARFTQIVGTQRFLHAEAAVELPGADLRRYKQVMTGPAGLRLRSLEDRTIQQRTARRPPVEASEWQATTAPALEQLEKVVLDGGDDLVERAQPVGIGIMVRLLLAGGLGLLAVIASIVVSITTARALVRQLERLRNAALELAERRLPGVVERLGHGEEVDVAKEAPPLEFGSDEIGQVGHAFNAVQETAIRTAVEQAELRRGIRDVLLSLARRTQTLVHRQLSMLDQMERKRDIDPKDLQELFRLDHLATRMRRNAENLIVLSGSIPARGWRRSVPMVDVVRAAVGEVEDYTRVQVLPIGNVELTGRAVGDVTHLLAELIENAVTFSPPDTVVQVGGHAVANGFALDIEDRGLGMGDEKIAELNQRIADPPEFNLQSSVQLGLFVVGKLAERYNLQVSLKRSAYGGTTAVVVIPRELVVDGSEADDERKSTATTQNGLEVRQPALTAATAAPETAKGPALVSVISTPPATSTSPATFAEEALEDEEALGDDEPAPELPSEADVPSTPGGLPVRVPQASLVPALKAEEPAPAPEPEDEPGRSPEEIQRIMGSYQRGTVRGRTVAAAKGAAEGEDEQ